MDGIDVEVSFSDFPSLDSGDNLLGQLTRMVEFDTKPYVKHDTGQTEESADASDFSTGVIVYSATDKRGRQYAGHAYEDPHVRKGDRQNPKATARWFERAQADRMGEWLRFVAESVAGGGAL